MNERKYDIDERLIDFAVTTIQLVESLPRTQTSNHLGNQLLRSGTSPSLNYGEAQSAESKNDFIHKMKLCLKELRESHDNMKIIHRAKIHNGEKIEKQITECNELISIFVKSLKTASGE